MSINKQLLQEAKALRLQKERSQSFLVDDAVLAQIVTASYHPDSSVPIIEIGAGSGFLTAQLLKTAHPLTVIEVDAKMVGVLKQKFPQLQVIHQDVLQVDLQALIPEKGIIVGNLPYHLTGPILFQITGELADAQYSLRQKLIKAVLMVQKEVGDRLIAQPGDSAYGQLTLQAQYWFNIFPVTVVSRSAFYPSPAVDSMVLELLPREQPAVSVQNLSFLSRLIKTAFLHRRKTLYNNLKLGGLADPEVLEHTLMAAGISLQQRPQEVSMQQFGALANAL